MDGSFTLCCNVGHLPLNYSGIPFAPPPLSLNNLSPSPSTISLPPCMLALPSRKCPLRGRRVAGRRPEEFKIACLQDIRSLWPVEQNPFYAGFGNRLSDATAYVAAGVPPARILIINPQVRISLQFVCTPSSTVATLVFSHA